jgi:hypothetical protein
MEFFGRYTPSSENNTNSEYSSSNISPSKKRRDKGKMNWKDNKRRRKLVGRLDAAFAYAEEASPRKRVSGQVPVDIIIAQHQQRQVFWLRCLLFL